LTLAVAIGFRVRRHLPDHHLNADTKDTVKIAMGLVATMSALLLGLLVSSTQDSYKTAQAQVITLGAQISVLDRMLSLYGPEAKSLQADARAHTHAVMEKVWNSNAEPRSINSAAGNALYLSLLSLEPKTELQRNLKSQSIDTLREIAQLRTIMHVQSHKTISWPLLIAVLIWFTVIFFSFSVFSPPNATASCALFASTLSVALAVFLILELNHPFHGLLRISPDLVGKVLPS
jgi:hypothetical protein